MLSKIFKKKDKKEPDGENKEIAAIEYGESEFLSDLEWTGKAYLAIVIVAAVLVAAAIAVAVIVKVSYGLILGIIAVVAYVSATGRVLYSRLGLSHDSIPGALRITGVYGKNRETVFVPRRLLGVDVTEIGDKAFCHTSSAKLKTVYLPGTLKTIGENVFEGCEALERICFEGNAEEWERIEIKSSLEGIEISFGEGVTYPEKPKKLKKGKKKSKKESKKESTEQEENKE